MYNQYWTRTMSVPSWEQFNEPNHHCQVGGLEQPFANPDVGLPKAEPNWSQQNTHFLNFYVVNNDNFGYSQPMNNQHNRAPIDNLQNPGYFQPMDNQWNDAQIQYFHNPGFSQLMASQRNGARIEPLEPRTSKHSYRDCQNPGVTPASYNQQPWNDPSVYSQNYSQLPSQQSVMNQKPMTDHMPIMADLQSVTSHHAHSEQEDSKNTHCQQPSTSGACPHPNTEYDAQALEHDDTRSKAPIPIKRKMMDVSPDHPSDGDDLIPEVSASPKKAKVIRKLRPRKMGVQCIDEKDEIVGSDDETMHVPERKPLKQTQKPKRRKKEPKRRKKEPFFKCAHCPQMFHFDHIREKHVLLAHSDLQSDLSALALQCDVEGCNQKFRNLALLKNHKSRSHNLIQPVNGSFDCTVCGKRMKYRQSYLKHMDIHNDTTYECRYCNRSFHHKNTLSSHYRHCSKVPEEDKAQGIGKRYRRKPHHLECNECNKTFTNQRNYQNHVNLHKGKFKHECKICQKKFNYTPHYTDHMNGHNRVKNFECEKCGDKFLMKGDLNKHNRRKHGGKYSEKCMENRNTDTPVKAECEKCGCKFRTKSDLKRHNRTHGGKCRKTCNTEAPSKVEKST